MSVLSSTDFQGDVTEFLYDGTGRLVAERNAAYLQVSYHYDAGGRLIDRILSNGARTTYAYDEVNRLTRLENYSASGAPVSSISYLRDAVGNVVGVDRGNGVVVHTYDALNRLKSVSVPGDPLYRAYTYDLVGNRKTEATNTGTRHFLYGPANRLQEIHAGSEIGPLLSSFVYDDNGAVVGREDALGNPVYLLTRNHLGQVESASGPGFSQVFGYDPMGYRVRREEAAGAELLMLEGEHLESVYDSSGSLRAKYLRGSLIDEVVSGYSFDPSGKPTSFTYHHDQVNSVVGLTEHTGRLEEASRFAPFGQEEAGGVSSFVLEGGATLPQVVSFEGAGESVLVADWDGQPGSDARAVRVAPNRLGYSFPIGDAAAPPVVFGLAASHHPIVGDWDGDGTLNAGVYEKDGCPDCLGWFFDLDGGGVGEIAFNFGLSSDTPITGDWDGDGTTNAGYVRPAGAGLEFHLNTDNAGGLFGVVAFGAPGDQPITGDWDGDGTTNVGVLRDVAGKPTFLLDTDGGGAAERTVVLEGASGGAPISGDWTGTGGAEGVGLRSLGSTGNHLRYTGRERDAKSGLYYYRARYYDPDLGRFLSPDPLGFEAGPNFYTYVGNNPVNQNDPMGLYERHEELTGANRVLREIADLVTFEVSVGAQAGGNVNIAKVVEVGGTLDLGSGRSGWSNTGWYETMTGGVSANGSIGLPGCDVCTIGVEGSIGKSLDYIPMDPHYSSQEGWDLLMREGTSTNNLAGQLGPWGSISTNDTDIKLGAGAALLFGASAEVNLTEAWDLYDQGKSYLSGAISGWTNSASGGFVLYPSNGNPNQALPYRK